MRCVLDDLHNIDKQTCCPYFSQAKSLICGWPSTQSSLPQFPDCFRPGLPHPLLHSHPLRCSRTLVGNIFGWDIHFFCAFSSFLLQRAMTVNHLPRTGKMDTNISRGTQIKSKSDLSDIILLHSNNWSPSAIHWTYPYLHACHEHVFGK